MTAGRLWAVTALVMVGLIASLVFAGLRLGWHAAGHTAIMPLEVMAPPPAPQQSPPREIDAILAFAPFGQRPQTDAPRTNAVPQSVNVTLRGVLVDPDPALSRAFIAASGETAAYRIGEPVQSAELVAINADTVTLQTTTGLVIVGFGGIENGAPAATDAPETPVDDPTDPFARLAAAIVPGQGSIDLREAPPPETTDEYINLWRDRITQNPQAAMETVGLELVENGYRIKEDPNIGVTLAGLRPGDVVTRLNGQQVGDLDSDRVLYDDVAAAGIARLEVVRDGQALLLTFPLR